MVGLIITLIAIALGAIIAVIALYSGGKAFTGGSDEATFARLQNEGNQIKMASEIYQSQYGKSPQSIEDLIEAELLKDYPLGFANSAEGGFQWATSGTIAFTLYENMLEERALAINKIAKLDSDTVPPCYTSTGELAEPFASGFAGMCDPAL